MSQRLTLPINKCIFTAGYKKPAYLKQQGYPHYGVDLFSDDSVLNVYACGEGEVIAAGLDGWTTKQRLGYCAVIVYRNVQLHDGTIKDLACRMFHFLEINVKKGDKVTANTLIGKYGNTGATLVNGKVMGYHLHLEFDTDTAYPQFAYGISSSGRVIQKGTTDSTVNPSEVWFLDEGQSIQGKYVGWFADNDINLPTLPEGTEDVQELKEELQQTKAQMSNLVGEIKGLIRRYESGGNSEK